MTAKAGFKKAVRTRMAETGETYQQAADAVDPARDRSDEIACHKCGWTYGMLCPECPGCGCYNLKCSGWRHHENMTDDELEQFYECQECGGDTRNWPYSCSCGA